MKKVLSSIAALSIIMNCIPFCTSAADTKVQDKPADIDKSIYDQFMDISWKYDLNSDGVMSQEELEETKQVSLNITPENDLSFLSTMKKCEYLSLSGTGHSEFPMLKDMSSLSELVLSFPELTDISFIKDLDLKSCKLPKQITLEQRLAVMRCEDITVDEGFEKISGLYPLDILSGHKCVMTIDDTDIADFGKTCYTPSNYVRSVYGVSYGETEYHVSVDGEVKFTGHITVNSTSPLGVELEMTKEKQRFSTSAYYDNSYMMLNEDNELYGIKGSGMELIEKDVKDFKHTSAKGAYNQTCSVDYLIKTDGTLFLNGKEFTEQKFAGSENGLVYTEDGELWMPYVVDRKPVLEKISDEFKSFPFIGRHYFLTKSGEVMWYNVSFNDKNEPVVTVLPTGVKNPKYSSFDMFIDENDVLWSNNKYSDTGCEMVKRAENVAEFNTYYQTADGSIVSGYKTLDGKYYALGSGEEVDVTGVRQDREYPFKYNEILQRSYYDPAEEWIRTFITKNNVLTFEYKDIRSSISSAEKVIAIRTDKETNLTYIYFKLQDCTIWRYCVEEPDFQRVYVPKRKVPETVAGDSNGDGTFNVADAVLVQQWLLDGKTSIIDWGAADLVKDGVIDIYDFCEIKKKLTTDSE